MEIVPPHDGRHGPSSAAEAEPAARGVEEFSSVCKIRYLLIFCLENSFMSRSVLSVTVIAFPHGWDMIFSYLSYGVIPYMYVDR